MDHREKTVSPTKPAHPGRLAPEAPGGSRTIDAGSLFGTARVVLIEYRGERYQLRQTRNGKLILTK
ncbi:hemin uptake protein hemP [Sulfuritortus calidifontis]|uniref:Hemin uptake protein hemP n=1 Tax=Sulfuritortus calidifontis TaxID=1914471 RepID=A0A4R3JTQ5_9PROT|nr:hemin uptake protein HemP [Sulfuritortus calidifontis]TCS70896.1 hemin uptake protein hemP [Sulfuritortus calidifontis]